MGSDLYTTGFVHEERNRQYDKLKKKCLKLEAALEMIKQLAQTNGNNQYPPQSPDYDGHWVAYVMYSKTKEALDE